VKFQRQSESILVVLSLVHTGNKKLNAQLCWTFNFVADLLPVQQSRPCWIQLCCQCVPGFT